MNLDPLEVRDRLRSIERKRLQLFDDAQTARNQCTHRKAIWWQVGGYYECMACDKRWDDLPKELASSVVKDWKETRG